MRRSVIEALGLRPAGMLGGQLPRGRAFRDLGQPQVPPCAPAQQPAMRLDLGHHHAQPLLRARRAERLPQRVLGVRLEDGAAEAAGVGGEVERQVVAPEAVAVAIAELVAEAHADRAGLEPLDRLIAVSSGWPTVWPKLSGRRRSSSYGSRSTSRVLIAPAQCTSRFSAARSRARMASAFCSMKSQYAGEAITAFLIDSASPERSWRSSSVSRKATFEITAVGW